MGKSESEIHIYVIIPGECTQQVISSPAANTSNTNIEEVINYLSQIQSVEKLFKQMSFKYSSRDRLLSVSRESLYVWNNSVLKRVLIDEIIYLKADRSYCEIHLADSKEIVVSLSLKEVEMHLPNEKFIRIHHSHTINSRYLQEISGNVVLMSDGEKMNIGREYRKTLMNSLNIINTQSKKYFP